MKPEEIMQALRCCEKSDTTLCPLYGDEDCFERLSGAAADLIEHLTAEGAGLRKELEWKDMVIALAQRKQTEAEAERDTLIAGMKAYYSCYACKHGDYCEFDDANAIDCMNCVKKNCPCAQCCDKSRWEWCGVSEMSEEGDHHEPET